MIHCAWRFNTDHACTDAAEVIVDGYGLCHAHALNREHMKATRFRVELEAALRTPPRLFRTGTEPKGT